MMGPVKFVYLLGQSAVAFAFGWIGMTLLVGVLTGVLMVPELDELAFQYGHILSVIAGLGTAYQFGGFRG